MISLGLKETKEVDFFEQFSDFIHEHYSVEPSNFEDAILDLIDTRQVGARFNLSLISPIVLIQHHYCHY
jgi:hydrogenase maturation factor HypF (carbamoyltransferase family)